MDTAHVYAEITKSDKLDDGTLLVRGIATSPALDIDQQICDPAWLSSAMPSWFKWGNIREQHSQIAAGVATELSEKDGGAHEIVARIVDPNSVKKVETGVLKGFSIGIRGPRISSDKSAPGGRIIGGEIVEVSLVDRPANSDCILTLAKAAVPGMVVKGDQFDSGSGLVKVEELAEKTAVADPSVPVAEGAASVQEGAGEVGGSFPAPAETSVKRVTIRSDGSPLVEDIRTPIEPRRSEYPTVGLPDAEQFGADLAASIVKGLRLDLSGLFKPGALGETVEKREFSDKERATMASAGTAMPGGGYPIKTIKDLRNAIQAIGRAKDPAAAKAHIRSRAKALGREDLIPEQWSSGDKAAGSEVMAHDPAVLMQVRNGLLQLIIAEAQEGLAGEREESDISCLTETLAWFLAWWDHETWEGEAPAPSDTKSAGGVTDGNAPTSTVDTCPMCGQSRTANPENRDIDPNRDATHAEDLPTATTPKEAEPDMAKAGDITVELKADGKAIAEAVKASTLDPKTSDADEATEKTAAADTVKAAVAEATEELRQQLAATLARLEQVEKQAAPGGPARVRTLTQETTSADADRLRTKAARLRAVAKTVSAPDIRNEYERQAAEVEQELNALKTA
jgi:hypothetical protein